MDGTESRESRCLSPTEGSRRDLSGFIRPNLIEGVNKVLTIDNFTQSSRPLNRMSVNDPSTYARTCVWMKTRFPPPVLTNCLFHLTSCGSWLLGPAQVAFLVFLT